MVDRVKKPGAVSAAKRGQTTSTKVTEKTKPNSVFPDKGAKRAAAPDAYGTFQIAEEAKAESVRAECMPKLTSGKNPVLKPVAKEQTSGIGGLFAKKESKDDEPMYELDAKSFEQFERQRSNDPNKKVTFGEISNFFGLPAGELKTRNGIKIMQNEDPELGSNLSNYPWDYDNGSGVKRSKLLIPAKYVDTYLTDKK